MVEGKMTERELFLEFAVSRGLNVDYEVSANGRVNFYDNRTAIAYDAWEESANREGFKFVPVEPTLKMSVAYKKNAIAPVSSLSVAGYKAMIGVVDEK